MTASQIIAAVVLVQSAMATAAKYGLELAKLTTTTVDDIAFGIMAKTAEIAGVIVANPGLVEFLKLILGEPEVQLLRDQERTAAIFKHAAKHGTAEVQQAAAAAGIDWQTLLTYLPTIIRLVLSFVGKR